MTPWVTSISTPRGASLHFVARVLITSALGLFLSSRVVSAQGPTPSRALGSIKSVSANAIVLTTDAGTETNVTVDPKTRLLRIAPGEKDLKNAQPIEFTSLQPGDRILVRGALGSDGKSIQAATIIAMKEADIAQKQAHEREEWQRHGVGGLVKSVDPSGAIVITTNASGPNKEITLHTTPQTVSRRYAPGSVKFDDAKPAPLSEIHTGDQLRARGTRNPEGTEFTADEIVSGSFRNVAGTVVSADLSAGVITVHDLAAKADVAIRVTPQTQMRKLPLPLAQRIASRLKGEPAQPSGPPSSGNAGAPSAVAGPARPAPGADFQQMISRLPAATLSDLQKGEAVMIVATEDAGSGSTNAVTLLAGVEPLLQASPKGAQDMVLSPWSLGGGGGSAGDNAGGDSSP